MWNVGEGEPRTCNTNRGDESELGTPASDEVLTEELSAGATAPALFFGADVELELEDTDRETTDQSGEMLGTVRSALDESGGDNEDDGEALEVKKVCVDVFACSARNWACRAAKSFGNSVFDWRV